MKPKTIIILSVLTACLIFPNVFAQTHYYYLPLRQLQIDGSWPDSQQVSKVLDWRQKQYLKYYMPYAVCDNGEEVYIDTRQTIPQDRWNRFNLWQIESTTQLLNGSYAAIKTEAQTPPTGVLYMPKPDLSGMTAVRFKLPSVIDNDGTSERQFYTVMRNHYEFLVNNGFAGTAWFRYRSRQARQMLEEAGFDPDDLQPETQFSQPDEFDEVMSLFTGARAVSENIQLDRELQTHLNQPRTVDVDTLTGITTAQIDWKDLVTGNIQKDPLARYIPADQHVIFYPTFEAMMTVMDEVKSGKDLAAPVDLVVEHIEQYEQQMCVWLDGWSRFWGSRTISGVAVTGSDPYMQSGTDMAILFDTGLTGMVYGNTESKQAEKLESVNGAEKLTGSIDGVNWQAVVSPDRAVSSYLAAVDDVVVVSNSLAQLEKIIQTIKSQAQQSIADLDEYTYFRSRYPLNEEGESAFLVMSDAAIRRWCGPRWRIGAARRAMAAAVLSQLQAQFLDEGEKFDLTDVQKKGRSWAPDIGTLSLTEAGVTSSTYGCLRFMTPIIELPIDTASEQEKEQYRRFRQRYQQNWQMYFDPIAVSLKLDEQTMAVDMTIRPLIAATVYRQYVQIAGNNSIQAGDGDVHPLSLLQLILAIDTDSDVMRQTGSFAMQMMNQDINALSWMGRWVTLYADEDPIWNEFAEKVNVQSEDFSEFLEDNINRLPVAALMDVENSAKLTLFLVSLRAFIQQTAPDMTTWENLTYNEKTYVKINLHYDAEGSVAIYYVILPNSLMVSIHEDLIKRAIDRSWDNDDTNDNYQWIGQHLAARVDEKAWPVIEMLSHDSYARYLQMQAWNNLPILNEWRAQKTTLSPTEFNEKYWNGLLTGPTGDGYLFNEHYGTMSSSVFGDPGDPKLPEEIPTPLTDFKDVQFGITFEGDGLRARTVIERKE